MLSWLVVALPLTFSAPPAAGEGSIAGTVVDAATHQAMPETQVVLRASMDGRFVPVAATTTKADGTFRIEGLPVTPEHVYLPGANRDGVHYPGPRIRLTEQRPDAIVTLTVRPAITEPCPLVVRKHEVTLRSRQGALEVTEVLLVDNPTSRSYIGRPSREGGRPATLRLSIPSDFERVTFAKEFYGRRFALIDGTLVTDIPWTPGERRVEFTYVLPNEERHRLWQRPLDLPSSRVEVRVMTDQPEAVSCNLPGHRDKSDGAVVFASGRDRLPAGYVLRVELGGLPVPWMSYARWLALLVLTGLIAAAVFLTRNRRSIPQQGPPRPLSFPSQGGKKGGARRRSISARS